MRKILSKGYTIKVLSWENDGDASNTEQVTVHSKECAKAMYKLCTELFGQIGNCQYEEAQPILKKWVDSSPDLVQILNKEYDEEPEILPLEAQIGVIMDINRDLLGFSDICYSRVCEKCEVFYSPKDIFVEEVKFE